MSGDSTAVDQVLTELLATPLLWSPHGPGYEHLDQAHNEHRYDGTCAVCRFSDRPEARRLVAGFIAERARRPDRAAVVDTRVMFHTTTTVRLGDLIREIGACYVEVAVEEVVDGMRFVHAYTPYGALRIPEDDLGGPVPDLTRLVVTIEVADG